MNDIIIIEKINFVRLYGSDSEIVDLECVFNIIIYETDDDLDGDNHDTDGCYSDDDDDDDDNHNRVNCNIDFDYV